jgi:hypothetical protein
MLIQKYKNCDITEHMDQNWIRNEDCKYLMNKTVFEVLKEYNINQGHIDDWILFFPCNYNNISKEVDAIPKNKNNKKIFIIKNCDQITDKRNIWLSLTKKYGRDKAKILMPETFSLTKNNKTIHEHIYDCQNHRQCSDINILINDHKDSDIYIMKKNIQRQEGLKITNSINDIINNKNNYIIAQRLLQDPYLINGRKINLRIYLLIVCENNKLKMYAHENGFMYYTKQPFKPNTTDDKYNITTGYINRQIYDTHPLTLNDFRLYLDDKTRQLSNEEFIHVRYNKLSNVVFKNVYKMLSLVKDTVLTNVCNDDKINTAFQLFGADVAINDNLEAQLIEINKGPDLGAKDKRDKQVKKQVVVDTFKVMNVIDGEHDFIEL